MEIVQSVGDSHRFECSFYYVLNNVYSVDSKRVLINGMRQHIISRQWILDEAQVFAGGVVSDSAYQEY